MSALEGSNNNNIQIREVWRDNLEEEIKLIGEVVDKRNYIALDTEFAGHVIPGDPRHVYQTMKANVEVSKLIQVGLTFTDHQGNNPSVWQFNLGGFDPQKDPCAKKSVQLLVRSGIDFNKNNKDGLIGPRFWELLMPSGAVLNHDVHWITFHGAYDVGYMVRFLTGKELPETEEQFLELVKAFFPNLYDVKYLIKSTNGLYGGLDRVAEALRVERVGNAHQAGSDSLLTSVVFMKVRQIAFNGPVPETHCGVLFGMGVDRIDYRPPRRL